MRNKFISMFTAISLVLGMFGTFSVFAQANISIGEYVQMGTYYGEPILWRCVDIDENGPLMLSDKIICLKAFDAKGEANAATGSHSRASGRQDYGSNYWADSNIRSWLNSAESAGNVQWLCGNPPDKDHLLEVYNAYDQEAGFLTNFTQSEQNAIREVTQKSLAAFPECNNGVYTIGTEGFEHNLNIEDAVQNYDTAYAEYVTDKMFLLDVKQANAVYNNSSILGEYYYIGEPTAKCIENSEYANPSLVVGEKYCYWLRTPFIHASYCTLDIQNDGEIDGSSTNYGGYGVRPAFYLSDSALLNGGGTETNPYTITDYPYEITALRITDTSGNEIYIPPKNESFIVEADITKTQERDAKDYLFVAVYDNSGALLNIDYVKAKFIADGECSFGFNIPAQEKEIGSIKAFVWNTFNSMEPLAESKIIAPVGFE